MTIRHLNPIYILILAGMIPVAAKANTNVVYRVSNGSAPMIDGIINDSEWEDAAVLPRFTFADNQITPYRHPMKLFLKYDANNLYIGLRTSMDFDMDILPVAHDAANIRNVDSMEFIFSPPGEKYFLRFIIERGGGYFEQKFKGETIFDPGQWNPEWQYKSHVIAGDFFATATWEGEVAIPWKTFGLTPPEPGKKLVLPAQIARYVGNLKYLSQSGTRLCTWGRVKNEWMLTFPSEFGTLEFMQNKPVFRYDSFKDGTDGMVALTGTVLKGKKYTFKNKLIDYGKKPPFVVDQIDLPRSSPNFRCKRVLDIKKICEVSGNWRIEDADGTVGAAEYSAKVGPSFAFDAAMLTESEEIAFVGRILQGAPQGSKVRLSLEDSSGNCFASAEQMLMPDQKWFEGRLSFAGRKSGENITAVSRWISENGNILGKYSLPLKIDQAVWNHLYPGEVTDVPYSWEPVKASTDPSGVELKILDHTCKFTNAPWPAEIKMHGEGFSAGAWNFIAETDSGKQIFQSDGPVKIVTHDNRGFSLIYSGKSSELSLNAEIRCEFDGLFWVKSTFLPLNEKSVTVKSLVLHCPMQPDHLRYMNGQLIGHFSGVERRALIGKAKEARKLYLPAIPFQMETSFNGWKYENTFNQFYWIGGEDRGIFFILPSEKNMAVKGEFNKVSDTPERFDFSINLINQPTRWSGEVNYELGMMLTPAKRIINAAALRRTGQFIARKWDTDFHRPQDFNQSDFAPYAQFFMHRDQLPLIPKDYTTTAFLPRWDLVDIQCGEAMPPVKDLKLIDDHIRGIRDSIGGMPMLWYDVGICPVKDQNTPYFKDWELYPSYRLPVETYVTLTCPAGSHPEYYLYGVKKRIEQGISCFYIDMTSFRTCDNRFHGCGWRDTSGEIHASIPFLQMRELFLRMQTLVKKNNPNGMIILHGSSLLNVWSDVSLKGEEWTKARNYSYDTLTPEYYQIMRFSSRQIGALSTHFAGLIYKHVPGALKNTNQAEIWGLALLHDDSLHTVHGIEIPGNMLVWQAMETFGCDEADCQFIPYWRNPLSEYPQKGIAVSSYERDSKKLLVLFNTSREKQIISLSKLGPLKFSDALYGGSMTDQIELNGRCFKLVLVQ